MAKTGNAPKFIVTWIIGLCDGVIIYILVAFFLVELNGGSNGGFPNIFAIGALLVFPSIGLPFALLLANIALVFVKHKADKINDPSEKNFNKAFLIGSILFSIVLIVVINAAAMYWIGNMSHPTGTRRHVE